mmetsp:Transcript_24050/g.40331  ORF Transcript_24050/g.40331 Transcript_24050/m.40331 type:complete len:485 (-) Transcript_24050:1258-2712(-)
MSQVDRPWVSETDDESLSVSGTEFTLPQGSAVGSGGASFFPETSYNDGSNPSALSQSRQKQKAGAFEFDSSDEDEGYDMPSVEEAWKENGQGPSYASKGSLGEVGRSGFSESAEDNKSYLLPDVTVATGAMYAGMTQTEFEQMFVQPSSGKTRAASSTADLANHLQDQGVDLSQVRPELLPSGTDSGAGQSLAKRVLQKVQGEQSGEQDTRPESKWRGAVNKVKFVGAVSRMILTLDELRMIPVPESAGTVKGYVVADYSQSKTVPTYKYFLQEEGQDRFVMAAKKDYRDIFRSSFTFSIDPTNVSKKGSGYYGRLNSNFMGSKYTMFDRGEQKGDLVSADAERRVLGAVVYEPTISRAAGGYRRMTAILPNVFKGRDKNGNPIMARWDDVKDMRNMHLLTTKTPSYKKINGQWHYCYKWGGRVKVPSVKNFQLVLQGDPDAIVVLFGKMAKNIYALDFTHPLSAHQAFAIAMSSLDSKLCMAI